MCFHASCFWSSAKIALKASSASLTCRGLLPYNDLRNSWRACLTSRALSFCTPCSAACLSAIYQVSWEIQDAHALVGHRVLMTHPLISMKAA